MSVSKDDAFCVKKRGIVYQERGIVYHNEKFGVKNEGLCIKNEGFCVQNDEFVSPRCPRERQQHLFRSIVAERGRGGTAVPVVADSGGSKGRTVGTCSPDNCLRLAAGCLSQPFINCWLFVDNF